MPRLESTYPPRTAGSITGQLSGTTDSIGPLPARWTFSKGYLRASPAPTITSADNSGAHGQDGSCVNWANPGGWHTFAARREPGLITFYFDGVEVFRTTQHVTGDPHYLILNYTTDESFGIVPDTEMLVDYVRVWENE